MFHRTSLFAALIVASTLLAGCRPLLSDAVPAPRAWSGYCTQVGCFDVLVVHLSGDIPAGYTVTVVPKDGASQALTCREDAASGRMGLFCRDDAVWFRGLTPEGATILVEWDGGQVTQVVTPTYHESQPNGPHCPPTCRSAGVTVELP